MSDPIKRVGQEFCEGGERNSEMNFDTQAPMIDERMTTLRESKNYKRKLLIE